MKGRKGNWLVRRIIDVNLPYWSGKRIIWRIEFKLMEGKGSRLYRLERWMIFDRGGFCLHKNLPNNKPFIRRGTMHGWKEEPRDPTRDRGNVRNSVWRFLRKSPISRTKAEYEGCATWSIPRGVSSHHVLVRAFGDASQKTWESKARHVSFCAGRGVAKEKVQRQKRM